MCQLFTHLQGLCCTCCSDESESTFSESERPLLDRSPPLRPLAMPKPRTYGSKRSVTSSGAAAIFGSERPSSTTTSSTLIAGPSASCLDAIDELTATLGKTSLQSTSSEYDADAEASSTSVLPGLEPLAAAVLADHDRELSIDDWLSIIPPDSTITKIAEASYAEVYRVKTANGSSIIKIMQLRVPSDEASLEIETANEVANVVSEIRIMNALTEVPGYVTFKATFVVQGPPPKPIVDAYHQYMFNEGGSAFPNPKNAFSDKSTFLVLELGDAGHVMESILINDISHIWDLFLGVVMALSRAELTNEFEHRDLHENNICVRIKHEPLSYDYATAGSIRFGFSGMEVTLIDYGLSRAKMENGEVIYNNLESDLAVFHSEASGIAGIQFDTYRRMRTHLITGTRTMYSREWHNENSMPATMPYPWKDFIPYTNVLWIRYILTYLVKMYKKSGGNNADLNEFTSDTKELNKRLNVKTKVENGAFTSAHEVLAYVVGMGWVSEEQLESYGVDESTLGEVSVLVDDGEVDENEESDE